MQRSLGAGEFDGFRDVDGRSLSSAPLWVSLLRLAVITVSMAAFAFYFIVDGGADTPATFSVASWLLMLLPPAALLVCLILGFWLRVGYPSGWRVLLSRASAAAAWCGLGLTGLFSLLWFFGEWMDYAIG